MASISCGHCNAWYVSERELRDHIQRAHRKIAESIPSAQANISNLDDSRPPNQVTALTSEG